MIDIKTTRRQGFGSSDAKIIIKYAETGVASKGLIKRLAVFKGFEEIQQFKTHATEKGHEIEALIFESIKKSYPNAISNKKEVFYAQEYDFDIFSHIDIEYETDNTLFWIECKATKFDIESTFLTYKHQLTQHALIGQQKAEKIGKKFVLKLAHYDTNDYIEFDEKKITFIDINCALLNKIMLLQGYQLVNDYLKSFNYEVEDDVEINKLPILVQRQCELVAESLLNIKELNAKVKEFNNKLCEILKSKNIKSISNQLIKFTLIDESESLSFDLKRFEKDYPEIYLQYKTKKETKKAYIKTILK